MTFSKVPKCKSGDATQANFKALEKSLYKQSELRGRKCEIPVTSSGEPRNVFLLLESLKACASEGRYKRGKPGSVYLLADRRECGRGKVRAMITSSIVKAARPHQLLRTTPQTHYSVCFTPLPVSLTAAPICHTLLTVGLSPRRCLHLALRKVERHKPCKGRGRHGAEGGVRRPVFCV